MKKILDEMEEPPQGPHGPCSTDFDARWHQLMCEVKS